MEVRRTAGEQTKRKRNGLGWSQRALAKQAKVAEQTIVNLEKGNYDPRLSTLYKIARALGVPVEELVREE